MYLNNELAGIYRACVLSSKNEFYFSDYFFDETKLRRSDTSIECEGQRYWKPVIKFMVRVDLDGGLSATPDVSDYEPSPKEDTREKPKSSDDIVLPPGESIETSALQHQGSLWRNSTGTFDASLALNGRQYTQYGLFSLESYLSSSAGRFQGTLSDASWRRNFPQFGVTAILGVNTFSSAATSSTLYGLSVGSNEEAITKSTTLTIDGFADVPGRLQIRSGGTLVKEIPVTAGFFQIPAGGLPATPGTTGQYSLTLVDAAGRAVKTWDVFVPIAANALRAGATTWRVFAGSVQTTKNSGFFVSGRRNMGGGFVLRHGMTSRFSLEVAAVAAELGTSVGISGVYNAASWVSLTGSVGKGTGDMRLFTTSAGADFHVGDVGASVGMTRQSCYGVYLSTDSQATESSAACLNIRSNMYFPIPRLGRLNISRTVTMGGLSRGEQLGFAWAPPYTGRVSWSVYGNRQSYSGAKSYSLGVVMTIPFGTGGNLANTMNFSAGSIGNSTTYSASDRQNNQYSVGVDVNRTESSTSGNLRAGVSYNPWFGNYSANTLATSKGEVSVGISEVGEVVSAGRQILPMRSSDQGIAIVHLPQFPHVSLVDGDGNSHAVTNGGGYAALPATRTGWTNLKVSPDELPDNVEIKTALTGQVSDDWSAMRWEPVVRKVNRGWIHISLPDGSPVPLGSSVKFKGEDSPDYVLGAGDMYVANLPEREGGIELRYPGDVRRCIVRIPSGVKLNQNYTEDMPKFVCYSPALYRSEYEQHDSQVGSIGIDGDQ
ncbi:hypothetical protein ACS0Y3_16860 [Burkholderia gladioli]|uniref:hypothetical protein n=1 Tax=Burkholderia gladioli TaxID=28095 RepID=UPI003F7A1D50